MENRSSEHLEQSVKSHRVRNILGSSSKAKEELEVLRKLTSVPQYKKTTIGDTLNPYKLFCLSYPPPQINQFFLMVKSWIRFSNMQLLGMKIMFKNHIPGFFDIIFSRDSIEKFSDLMLFRIRSSEGKRVGGGLLTF